MKTTQLEWVKRKIDTRGYITRNECLNHFVSRLGAIICRLKKQGYRFTAYYNKKRDYIYELKK